MTFAHPSLLFLLIVPTALLIWVWRRADRRLVLPFDYGRPGDGTGWRIMLNTAEMLPALLLGLVIVLLAGPQTLSAPRNKRSLTNIELCVNVSGSMASPFGEGTCYDASMAAIDSFLDKRKGDAFGLTFFGHSVLHWTPLTTDSSAIRCSPPFMRPGTLPHWFGGTEIGRALRACKATLTTRQEGDRMIILVSDGMSSDMQGGEAAIIGNELKESNIAVYAIHIGGDDIPEPIVQVTSLTGGEVFAPEYQEGLHAVFARIDQMKQARLEKTLGETIDNFLPFCLVGLSLVGMCTLTLFGLRYTPW